MFGGGPERSGMGEFSGAGIGVGAGGLGALGC